MNAEQRADTDGGDELGFPLGGWWQWRTMKSAFGLQLPAVTAIDASYVDDFWTMPGYAGFDDPALTPLRSQFDTSIDHRRWSAR